MFFVSHGNGSPSEPHAYSEGGLLQVHPVLGFPFYGHKKD